MSSSSGTETRDRYVIAGADIYLAVAIGAGVVTDLLAADEDQEAFLTATRPRHLALVAGAHNS